MRSLRFALALLTGAFFTTAAFAHKDHEHGAAAEQGTLVPANDVSADWLAQAKAAYPTDKCVVSDEKLGGDMGAPKDYVYKQEGKPDRLVRFCCKDCVKDFKKDPEKYLSSLDAAASSGGSAEHKTDHAHSHSH